MKLQLVSAPASEPITVSDLKTHLRIDAATEDSYLPALIAAARETVEQRAWRALFTQTWDLTLDRWPSGRSIKLPKPPLQSVTYVKYTDEDGVQSTLSSDAYVVDTAGEPGRIVLKIDQSWPSATLQVTSAIVVRFVCGWASTGSIPPALVHAVRLLAGHYYENREATMFAAGVSAIVMPFGVDALVQMHSAREF